MISLNIIVEVAPDKVAEFIQYITEEAADARTLEPGCKRFEISRSLEKPNVFTLAELYVDEAALEAHRQTPHFLLFKQRAQELALIVHKTAVLGQVIDA
jgi:(4S)-4-hydroxy-5-phosphonooxypentane-2,3-dione isomerase